MSKIATALALVLGCISSLAGAADSLAPGATTDPPFDLLELRVLGNTKLESSEIEQVLMAYVGPGRTLKDVQDARSALELTYHNRGYATVYVDIPEQEISTDGIVRLKVTEARIRRTTTVGARYFSNRRILAALPEAKPESVPSLLVLQGQLAAVNQTTPDRTVTPVLKAGAESGSLDLELQVRDHLPFHGSVEVNNQYTSQTPELRAAVSARYDDAFANYDSLGLQYQFAPQAASAVSIVALTYTLRLSSVDGNAPRLSASFFNSSSNISSLGDLTIAGKGKTYELQYIRPAFTTEDFQGNWQLGVTFKDSLQTVSVGPSANLLTPIKYTSLSTGYSIVDHDGSRLWLASFSLALGLPGLGARRDQFADKCFDCRPEFIALKTDVELRQKLFWGLEVHAGLAGQVSPSPLVSTEQYLLGGAHSVRGYLEAEALGDMGVRSSIELRWGRQREDASWRLTPFVFTDAGVTALREALPGQQPSTTLLSAGLGAEMSLQSFLASSVSIGWPLRTTTQTPTTRPRLQFSVRGLW